jgi:hypothetical protein
VITILRNITYAIKALLNKAGIGSTLLNIQLEHGICVRFEVLTAVSTKTAVFWVVTTCSLVEVYERFPDDGGSKYLLNVGKLLPDYTVLTTQKTAIFMAFVLFIETSNRIRQAVLPKFGNQY